MVKPPWRAPMMLRCRRHAELARSAGELATARFCAARDSFDSSGPAEDSRRARAREKRSQLLHRSERAPRDCATPPRDSRGADAVAAPPAS